MFDGSNGYLITGKNGNSIFMPATRRYVETELKYLDFCGQYQLSDPLDLQYSFCLLFEMENHTSYFSDVRYQGLQFVW